MVTFDGNSVKEFLKGFRSESTKATYQKKLVQFLNHINVEPDQFLAPTRKDPAAMSATRLSVTYEDPLRKLVLPVRTSSICASGANSWTNSTVQLCG